MGGRWGGQRQGLPRHVLVCTAAPRLTFLRSDPTPPPPCAGRQFPAVGTKSGAGGGGRGFTALDASGSLLP